MKSALLLVLLLNIFTKALGQNLSNSYKEISRDDFRKFDSLKVISEFKGITLYNGIRTSSHMRSKFRYFVIKTGEGKTKKYYQLDYQTELLNDSTVRFLAPPFLMIGGKSTWEDGLWFYADFYNENGNSGTRFNLDSIPENRSELIKNSQTKGIYKFNGKSLVKISGEQSEEVFYKIKKDGLYYIPNPGRFYLDVKLNEIVY